MQTNGISSCPPARSIVLFRIETFAIAAAAPGGSSGFSTMPCAPTIVLFITTPGPLLINSRPPEYTVLFSNRNPLQDRVGEYNDVAICAHGRSVKSL